MQRPDPSTLRLISALLRSAQSALGEDVPLRMAA